MAPHVEHAHGSAEIGRVARWGGVGLLGMLAVLFPTAMLSGQGIGFFLLASAFFAPMIAVVLALYVLLSRLAPPLAAEGEELEEEDPHSEELRAYAEERELTYEQRGDLPPSTPLLRAGHRRDARHLMRGRLPGGLYGTLAHYDYVASFADGRHEGREHTIVLARVPEALGFLSALLCHRRDAPIDPSGAFSDDQPHGWEIDPGREALRRRYRIRAGTKRGEQRARELLSPSFAHWLADEVPEGFAFELVGGALCVSVPGHLDDADSLDRLSGLASRVAERMRVAARPARVQV